MIPQDGTLTKNISVQNSAGYINDDWVLSPWWRVNTGLRRDSHSTFGLADTYKLSSAFLLGNDCMLKTSYGTSFRAPSIADLYYQDAWGNAGNPNLRPEAANNFDLELSVKTGAGTIRTSYFDKKITNLIEWISAPDWSSSSPNNVGRARLSGIEMEWSGALSDTVLFYINGTQMLDASNEITGGWLQYRARTKVNLGITVELPVGSVALRTNYVSERSSSTGGALNLPRYYVTDIDFTKDNISLFMHNVFNRQYQEYLGYDMPGRTLGVKVSLAF
jgi:vitamin B12 transporter